MPVICHCRQIFEKEAHGAIKQHKPENAEEIHRLVKGEDPMCGTCLATLQHAIDHHAATGDIPPVLKIGRKEQDEASLKLGARFAAANTDRPKDERPPGYQRLYLAQHRRRNLESS